MNSSRWGLDEQDPVVVEAIAAALTGPQSIELVDEQDPVEDWMNRTPWRAG